MIKLGIFSWFSYSLPIEERLQMIKQAGFDATSLWWDGEDKYLQPELARKIGLQIDNIHLKDLLNLLRTKRSIWLLRI